LERPEDLVLKAADEDLMREVVRVWIALIRFRKSPSGGIL
jgi:hypothetical protein